jgi:hypothetical protein
LRKGEDGELFAGVSCALALDDQHAIGLACVALLLNGLGEPRAEAEGSVVFALDGSGLSPEVTAV